MKFVIFNIFLIFFHVDALAQKSQRKRVIKPEVRWFVDDAQESKGILINLSKTLNRRQITTINSGFSTFSLVKLTYLSPNTNSQIELSKRSCTVKLDTWDEIYDITKLERPIKMLTAKNLEKYFSMCLTAKILDENLLEAIQKRAGKIHASIQIEQISASQSIKIKEWLINQQSGVMQGLFSHMLGKIIQKDTLEIVMDIPPMPRQLIKRTQKPNIYGALDQ